ncbi:MAG: hypothetical protein AVDCRST_MAG90-2494 [uncultured Microvirga sp.]|uniref:Lipoprotein n=1 Tax=uncultured Microvirga sp. TaxID=412392 RepID=A0A6J4M7S7_9HYPH|nr:MAG: hypothetical protein AVDCRST_MAG90-2494 [uncultured Microvirga sp.]
MERFARMTAVGLAVGLALAGCNSSSSEGAGSTLRNLVMFGGPTVPAPAAGGLEDAYCPRVGVIDGGAALQAYAGRTGDPNALRNQISLTELARECVARPDGATLVKVGVEGRALLGPGASAGGRFEAPVRVVIKSGDRVLATRFRRVPVTIPAGDTQGSFTVVEEGLVVPPGSGEFEIEVGLGGAGGPERPARRRG